MKKTIDKYDFINEFEKYGRGNQFTRAGLIALFEYLEQYEEDAEEQIELDVIGLCCEYTEYSSIDEFNNNGGIECDTIEELEEYTQVIRVDDKSFIIQDF